LDCYKNLIISEKEKNKEINIEFEKNSINFWLNFFDLFSLRDFLSFLGIRTTTGSADFFPLRKSEMLKGFNKMHTNPNENKNKKGIQSILTVGARALSKHYHRSNDVNKKYFSYFFIIEILADMYWEGKRKK